jgi:hypothetical protein
MKRDEGTSSTPMTPRLIVMVVALAFCMPLYADDALRITEPPESWRLDPFYKKHVSANGIPVVGSEKVSDYALLEAAYLINSMLDGRDDIREALIAGRVRCAVMAVDELTTDVPEHSDLEPKRYWDRRARGLGPTRVRPAVSCGEENLLGYRGDPYAKESILVHEFAHAIHQMGLNSIDRTFDRRLRRTYEKAMERGLWEGTYAAANAAEYWAEGVQSWFDTNRPPDSQHNDINTREKLREYDPDLAALIAEVFRDNEWRYVHPSKRDDPAHLAGYDPSAAPVFRWPRELRRRADERRSRRSSRAAREAAPT